MAKYVKTKGLAFKVRKSKIQGFGAFAIKRIAPGRRLIEYVGERIGPKQERLRYRDEDMDRHHTFLFSVDEHMSIDAAVGGNEARFLNHSCDPNCEAVEEDERIYLESIKNIQPGAELCYDYGFQVDEEDLYEEIPRYPCRCGTGKCRGTILKINKRQQKQFKHLLNS